MIRVELLEMRAGFAVLAALSACASFSCRDVQGGRAAPREPDAGVQEMRTCTQTVDCGGRGVCVAGLCQSVSSCNDDSECAAEGKVCHAQRFFCVECDGRPAQCPAGAACQFDFTCVSVSSPDAGTGGGACSGACTDRNQCPSDRVCRMGACCAPPSRCTSPLDCPAAQPECNGATGQCFGGGGCFADGDCNGEAGCAAGACACEISGAPPGVCRQRSDECTSDADCRENGAYRGKFCTLSSPPRRCLDAPACQADVDCSNEGLVCDRTAGSDSFGRCKNGVPCSSASECSSGQACVGGVCVAENCRNTPSLCNPASETCDPATGTCRTNPTGQCVQDGDCQSGYYCDLGASPGRCSLGCRGNADCAGGGICNAQHQCEAGTGAMCGPCTDDPDCPAGTRCVDATGLCHEPCSNTFMIPCSDPGASCNFGSCSCIF